MENASSFQGETCLTHCGSPSHCTPCAFRGMDRPRYTGRVQRAGQGGGRRKGLCHRPARKWAGPGALRPLGSEPSSQPAGRRLGTWDPVPPLLLVPCRAECDSRGPRLDCGDSPVEGGGIPMRTCPARPSPRLAMDPPRYTPPGGAGPVPPGGQRGAGLLCLSLSFFNVY